MDLIVQRIGDKWQASYGGKTWRAAVGHNGILRDKAEGDGVSPAGCWPIRRVLYRADKLGAPPRSVFTTAAIDPQDGWCDAPEHPDYNRPVRLPFAASREELWRQDDRYDIVVVLGHNDNPIIPGGGSAIFLPRLRLDGGLRFNDTRRSAGIPGHGGARNAPLLSGRVRSDGIVNRAQLEPSTKACE